MHKALLMLVVVSMVLTALPTAVAAPLDDPLTPAAAPPTHAGPARPDAPALAAEWLSAHPGDRFAAHAAMFAVQEAQGIHAPGTTQHVLAGRDAAIEASAAATQPPPSLVYQDAHPFCDVNGDGIEEVIVNQWDLGTLRTWAYLYDGATGNYLRSHYQYTYFPPHWFNPGWTQSGLPEPQRDFVPANMGHNLDLNGNGSCDYVTYTFSFSSLGPTLLIHTIFRAYDGATGQTIWSSTTGEEVSTFVPVADPLGVVTLFTLVNFPTSFGLYETPTGPKIVWKTSDWHFYQVQEPLTGIFARSEWVSEHIQLRDASNGDAIWREDLLFAENTNRRNYTWVSGVADINGDQEPEVFLHQMWETTPRTNNLNDPLAPDERPLYRYGRGMAALALDGRPAPMDERRIWNQTLYDEGVARANPPQMEENFESLVWTHATILPDMDNDTFPDVVAHFLTVEGNMATTVNGQFKTHFMALSGGTGQKLWDKDSKFQGWGFPASLSTGNRTQLIGIGTVDLPTAPPEMGHFPPKDVRLAAIEPDTGVPVWAFEEQFPQDSFVSYDLALQQYMVDLAPFDLDGDGVLDLVTPGQYVEAAADKQKLLSTATQRFDILSGATGDRLQSVEGWGSNGLAASCGRDDSLTVVGGYGKRFDANRLNISTAAPEWHWPLYVNAAPTATTLGVDLQFAGVRCADVASNRTFINTNLGLASLQRGAEFIPTYGWVEGPDEDLLWHRPAIDREVPLTELLDRLFAEPPVSDAAVLGANVGVAAPGLLLGLAVGRLHNKRAPRVRDDDLPDLYRGA